MAEPIITKQCSKCKEIKPVSEFYRRSARKSNCQSQCKQCYAVYSKTETFHRQRNVYMNKYRKNPEIKTKIEEYRKKYRQTKEYKEWLIKYRQSKKYKISQSKRDKQYNKLHPDIKATQQAVRRAVKSGRLPKPTTLVCDYCNKQAKHYHHPNGYDKEHRFDVVPVCYRCHILIHCKSA